MFSSFYTVLLIDDEPLAHKEMRYLLREHEDFVVEWEAGSIAEARRILSHHQPDVVFLDIHLRGGNGFELIELIHEDSNIVFVTAYDDYAVRAFEVNALDYLTKPVSPARLASTLHRLRRKSGTFDPTHCVATAQPDIQYRLDDTVLIATSTGRVFINCAQIHAISAVGGNYLAVRMTTGLEHVVRGTIKDWEQKLPNALFLRVHRNAIVNISRIRGITRSAPRKHALMLKDDDTEYSISRHLLSYIEHLFGALPHSPLRP